MEVASSDDGAVSRLTLNSPQNRNALSRRLVAELAQGLADAERDDRVRVVVLAAKGRAFCSGADLSERLQDAESVAQNAPKAKQAEGEKGKHAAVKEGTKGAARGATPTGPTLHGVFTTMATMHKPVIAEVHAAVRAGGMGLVAASDLAVAGRSATFAFTEVRVGVAPAMIAVPALRVMAPRALARHMLTGEVFGAVEAKECGLVTDVVEDTDLTATVAELCSAIEQGAPKAVGATKALLARLRTMPWEKAMADASALSERLFASDEAAEGMAAFLQKRPPTWATEL